MKCFGDILDAVDAEIMREQIATDRLQEANTLFKIFLDQISDLGVVVKGETNFDGDMEWYFSSRVLGKKFCLNQTVSRMYMNLIHDKV